MTRNSRSFARILARLADERGFSLLETIIAIGVVFGSLLVLAYTATVGFGYESLARQRQSATGLANRTMEQARGLAYSKIQTGMLTSELTGDPNVVTSCAGDAAGVYRFISCTPGEIPGSGEKIVHSATAANPTVPLVPHVSTVTENGIDFTIRTYVTNDCTIVDGIVCTALDPYRVTMFVTWTGGRSYPTKLVRLQSLFYSPTGCRSTATHPFAAPCQPYFFGTATVPRGEVNIVNKLVGGQPTSADLFAGGVESIIQHEQLTQAQGGYTPTGVQLADAAGTSTAGGTTEVTAAADTDPGSTTLTTYATSSFAGTAAGSLSSGSGAVIALTSPAGDTARSDATTEAGVVNVCPPPTDTGETDGQPCAGSRIQQAGTLEATADLNGLPASLGSVTLARVGATSSDPNKTFVDHVLYPEVSMCSPVSGADGCLETSASRRFGTINIGGLPPALAGPLHWNGSDPWKGYLVSVVGYADQVSAPVGRQVLRSATAGAAVPVPAASVTAGTVYYWDPTIQDYASLPATSDGLIAALQASSVSLTQDVGGRSVTFTMQVLAGSVSKAMAATTTAVGGAGNLSRTDALAQATPPKLTLRYQIAVDGVPAVDLEITLNLKTMEARGLYAPAPVSGS